MLNKSRRPTRLILSSLFFAVLLCGRVIFAQEQVAAEFVQTFHIVDIKVEGNKKTKPVVILREMKTQSHCNNSSWIKSALPVSACFRG